ncbi:MAG: LysM peptidoglycan-binding domain-containing protein [Synechococcales cyanobacterium CRU_2_2]|nr:LysM peptidoglycan-binding domain-containing protein [Synechococcales cyanobacterium CRU_2_2]
MPSEFRYTVQAGDSLSKIAEKTLGDPKRWPEIGILNGIADPSKLSVGMVLRIPVGEQGPLEVAPLLGNVKQKVTREGVKFTQEQDNIFATWLKQARKEAVGVAYQKGLYRRGTQTPQSFIAEARSLLAGLRLSNSEMRAIAAAAENEGYLDAVNTWDSQYLSFGMFQWTAGSPELPGELGELLTQLKRRSPEEFQHYFQQFGLDVDGTDGVRGWLSLHGTRLISDYQKTILRQPIWAYRFAIAGSDPMVQAAEVLHAVTRLDTFYFVKQSSLDGYSLSRLITSELGVALLLDNHINRPAYVAPGLAEAMWQLGLAPQDLAQASTAEEQRVLDRYLKVRETYGTKPMTHAKTRGDRIRRQVAAGNLSNQRGSFVSNRALRRG